MEDAAFLLLNLKPNMPAEQSVGIASPLAPAKRKKRVAAVVPEVDESPAEVFAVDRVNACFLESLLGYNARRASLSLVGVFVKCMEGFDLKIVEFSLLSLVGSIALRPKAARPSNTTLLIVMMLVMGLLWSMSFDHWFSAAGWGYGAKYALAALSLWYLSKTGVRLSAIVWGLACGATGALAIAAYQAGVQKVPLAAGCSAST